MSEDQDAEHEEAQPEARKPRPPTPSDPRLNGSSAPLATPATPQAAATPGPPVAAATTPPPQPSPAAFPGTAGKSAAELFAAARQASGLLKQAPGKPEVDKYFGSKLPPVCRQLGCYVTDDGKFFYCINPHCHKDKRRETKYNRRKKSVVYFFCPKCRSREIQLHLKASSYECLDCAYSWKH